MTNRAQGYAQLQEEYNEEYRDHQRTAQILEKAQEELQSLCMKCEELEENLKDVRRIVESRDAENTVLHDKLAKIKTKPKSFEDSNIFLT